MTSHLIHRFCVVAAFALAAIGPVRAQLLLDTTADFTLSAQGANGLYYGYFDGPETESSSFFHTNGIATNAAQPDLGEVWQGTEAFGTPLFSAGYQHPGASDGSSAVRRYLVGAGDEPDYTGWVRIQGSFGGPNPYGTGSVGVFVNVNDTNLFSMVTGAAEAVGFDLLAWVAPTWFIDFGVRPNGDAAFDVTPFHATVTAVPEPATTGAMGAALALLVVTFGRRRPPVDRGEAESSRPLS